MTTRAVPFKEANGTEAGGSTRRDQPIFFRPFLNRGPLAT
jgi:hypothetical protein